MQHWPFRVLEGGRLSPMGVDIGPARILKESNGYMVVKVRGHRIWSAIGYPWSYVPACYIVFEVLSRQEDVVILKAIIDFGIREGKREKVEQ